MNKYDKAAMLIGKYGTGAEADAIVKYLEFISAIEENDTDTHYDIEAVENSKERIADELNHLLGDTLDAMRIAGLKIASDGINQIFAGFMELVDWSTNDDSSTVEVEFTEPEKHDDKWKVEAEVKNVKPSSDKEKIKSDLINL